MRTPIKKRKLTRLTEKPLTTATMPKNIVMNSTLKTLTTIPYHRLTKLSITKSSRIMVILTAINALTAPLPTQQMPTKKCKIIQMTGVPTVQAGWIKLLSKKKMTKP